MTKKDFQEAQEKNPSWGDYIVLAGMVRGKGFRKSFLQRYFNKFVPSDDYDQSEKRFLIKNLDDISNEELSK